MKRSLASIIIACAIQTSVLQPSLALEINSRAQAVVELFTSQGCSRCPEADALLADIETREGVVALAYHIDYWDYIGWQDTFASPQNTALQKAYAQSWGKNRVYTPQMIINGTDAVVGSDVAEVHRAIDGARSGVAVTLTPQGQDAVAITVPASSGHRAGIVWLVTYRDAAQVTIERGENSGRVLDYTHIVTGRQAIGMWNPETGSDITVPLEEVLGTHSDGAAVIIQEKNGELPGAILGAASFSR